MKILALPRDPGPFQDELYAPMADRHDVEYLDGPTPSRSLNLLLVPLLLIGARRAGTRVLHVHWVFGFVPGWCSGRRLAIVFRWWFGVCLATAHRVGLRIVWTAHNTVPHAPVFDDDEAARRTLVRYCDAIVAPTDAGAAEVRARFTPTCPVTTIPLPAPTVPAPVRTPAQVRAYYGVPRDAVLLVFAGKVEPYKGVDDLLAALRLLADDPALPRVELVVAGVSRSREHADRTSLTSSVREAPRSDRVHLDLRHLPDLELAELLAAADAVVLPFRHVTTSASVLHAMAAGAACLVPDLPAFADLPDNAVLRYPPGADPVAALADALRTVVQAGKPLRTCIGHHAALHALTRDPQDAARRYADLYDELAVRPDTVLLTPWAPAHDGLARHSADLAAALTARGTTIAVVTASPGPSAPDVTRLRRPLTARRVAAAARDARTVHLQVTVPAWGLATFGLVRACRSLRADGVRVVVTLHEVTRELALLGPVARRLYRAFADATDMIVVHTPSARHALLTCGIPDEAVTTIPHGAFGSPASDRGTSTTAPDPTRVLCFGYLHPDKGFERAIDAVAHVPGAHLVVAGAVRPRRGLFRALGRRDHRYAAALQRRAASVGATVTFPGAVSDPELDDLLASAALVVLPYRSATQSGVLNRAVAAGAAIVATDLPGLRADLPPSAVLVPADDPDCTPALAAVLRDLLALPVRLADLRRDVVKQSRRHGPDRVAAALAAVYEGTPAASGDDPAASTEEPADPPAPSIAALFARGVRGPGLAVPAQRKAARPAVPAPRAASEATVPAPPAAAPPAASEATIPAPPAAAPPAAAPPGAAPPAAALPAAALPAAALPAAAPAAAPGPAVPEAADLEPLGSDLPAGAAR